MDRVDEMLPVLSPFPNTVPVGFTSLANPRVHTKQGVWLDSCYQNHRDSSQIPGLIQATGQSVMLLIPFLEV